MFQPLLVKLSEGFEKQNIPYMIIGGQAVLVYGEPRLTKDIDVTLGVGVERLPDVLRLVEAMGFKVLTANPVEFVRKAMVLPCQDTASGIRVDIVFSFSPYERQAMSRVRRVRLEGKEVCFASPEDLLIHKVIAGRPRDWEDIQTVFRKNPGVDRNYIEKWLMEFEGALNRPLVAEWKKKIGR